MNSNKEFVLKDWKNALEMKNEASRRDKVAKPVIQMHATSKSASSNLYQTLHSTKNYKASKHNGKNISNSELRNYLKNLDEKLSRHDITKEEIIHSNEKEYNEYQSFPNFISPIKENYEIKNEIICMMCENFYEEDLLHNHLPQCTAKTFRIPLEKLEYCNYRLNELERKYDSFHSVDKSIKELINAIQNEINLAISNDNHLVSLNKNMETIKSLTKSIPSKPYSLNILNYSNATIKFLHDKMDSIKELGSYTIEDKGLIFQEIKEDFNAIMNENFKGILDETLKEIMAKKVPYSQWNSFLKSKLNVI